MNIHELPMIIFTVVAQMSIGAFWALGAIQVFGRYRKLTVSTIDRITDVGMYAVGTFGCWIYRGFLPSQRPVPRYLHNE